MDTSKDDTYVSGKPVPNEKKSWKWHCITYKLPLGSGYSPNPSVSFPLFPHWWLINSRIGNPVIGLCFLENLNTQDNSIPKVVTVKKKQKEWHIQKVSDIRVFWIEGIACANTFLAHRGSGENIKEIDRS